MALAGEHDFPHEGTLKFLDNQLDPATGTIRGRAVFRNTDGSLTPGLFVRLRLPGGGSLSRHCSSQDRAVGTDLDKRFVFVVGGDETVAVPRRDARARWSTACAWSARAWPPASRSSSTACSASGPA